MQLVQRMLIPSMLSNRTSNKVVKKGRAALDLVIKAVYTTETMTPGRQRVSALGPGLVCHISAGHRQLPASHISVLQASSLAKGMQMPSSPWQVFTQQAGHKLTWACRSTLDF